VGYGVRLQIRALVNLFWSHSVQGRATLFTGQNPPRIFLWLTGTPGAPVCSTVPPSAKTSLWRLIYSTLVSADRSQGLGLG
jgi:hypothetical protein